MNKAIKKVLVADDDMDNRTIACEFLTESGYHVLEASDGEEAVQIAMSQKPDVILMDLTMPKMDGWQAARKIRERPELSGVPLIAFTAHAMAGDEIKARASGCDDYLIKPCPPKRIADKVKEWLSKPRKT